MTMRFTGNPCAAVRAMLVAALVAWACGGEESGASRDEVPYPQPNPTPPSQLERQRPSTPPTGVVHDVRMARTPDDRYVFEPAALEIRNGDRVRWTVESGIPHNVAFYPESIPPGADRFLLGAMPADRKVSPLGGRILTQPSETFEILFAGAPAGRYRYFCIPHEFAGMKGTIVVRP